MNVVKSERYSSTALVLFSLRGVRPAWFSEEKKGTVHINYRFLPTPLACRTFVMDRQERGQYTQMQAPHEEIIKESVDHRGVYSACMYVDISGNPLIPCNRGSFI